MPLWNCARPRFTAGKVPPNSSPRRPTAGQHRVAGCGTSTPWLCKSTPHLVHSENSRRAGKPVSTSSRDAGSRNSASAFSVQSWNPGGGHGHALRFDGDHLRPEGERSVLDRARCAQFLFQPPVLPFPGSNMACDLLSQKWSCDTPIGHGVVVYQDPRNRAKQSCD